MLDEIMQIDHQTGKVNCQLAIFQSPKISTRNASKHLLSEKTLSKVYASEIPKDDSLKSPNLQSAKLETNIKMNFNKPVYSPLKYQSSVAVLLSVKYHKHNTFAIGFKMCMVERKIDSLKLSFFQSTRMHSQ